MSLPRSTLPIGAMWLQSTGPNGSATSADNIENSESLSSAVMGKKLKQNVTAALGSYLGLSADRAKTLDVKYTDLKVDRVRDVAKVAGLSSGQRLLYAAVKASTIEINATSGTNATLRAAAEAKGIKAVLSAGSGNTSVLKLDGRNLYIAYRVMEIGRATTTETKASFVNTGGGFEAVAAPYKITRLDSFNQVSGCNNPSSLPQTRFSIVNEQQPDITGTFPTQEVVVDPGIGRSFPLAATQTENTIFARRVTISYVPTFSRRTLPDGRNVCMLDYPDAVNFVSLTTSTFELKAFDKPSGL